MAGITTASAVHASSAAAAVAANQPARSVTALALDASGNGFAFYRGQGDAVYMRTISGGVWSGQTSLDGVIVGAPAAAIIPGGVVVAGRGTDSALWLREMRGGTWSQWHTWGGIISASPAITAAGDRIDAFGRGTDGALWTRTTLDGTSVGEWQQLAGRLVTGPAASSSGSGSINVYVVGTDQAVWTRSLSGGTWSAWRSLGGRTYSAPAAAWAPQTAATSVFVRGTDNTFFVNTVGASGPSGWRRLGGDGVLIDGPAAAASGNSLTVAVRGTDTSVWQASFSNGSLSPWVRVWAPAAPAPPASGLLSTDWTRIPTTAHVVALTFDAGANADGVPAIDSTLRSKNVPATFFLTGTWVQEFPAQANLIAAGGYVVGNHSMTHPYFTQLTDAQVAAQVRDAQQAIITTNGVDPRPLFRFPFGDVSSRVIGDVNRLGYVPVRWTVDTLGWEGTAGGQSRQTVIDRVLGALQPGEIVLMHVGSAPDGSTLDASALPTIIDSIRARGYTFVTLHALTGS